MDDPDFGTKGRVLPQGIYNYIKYESFITYHSKAMANVKVFANKPAKKLYVPDLSMGGGGGRKVFLPATLS